MTFRRLPSFSYRGLTLSAITLAVFALSACSSMHEPWTYLNPPHKNDYFDRTEKIIWCETKTAAQAMAITGFFATGCQYTSLEPDTCRVAELLRESFGTTSVVFVRCAGPEGTFWFPLPSHHWA